MRALTVIPEKAGSAKLDDIPEPDRSDGALLVETLAVGVCGTDLDIVRGLYGWAPPGRERLVIGHESLGRVLEAPPGAAVSPGDLVVGIVRRPDPLPCPNCAVGEWDMCRNGRYTERGIKEIDGYASDRFCLEPEFAVKLDPSLSSVGVLLEPTSVVAKAWEHIERIGRRAKWEPKRVLVTGAGPIGLLAALLGVQRGLDVHVLDIVDKGPKPGLVRKLGATYHVGDMERAAKGADIVLECTGAVPVLAEALKFNVPDGIVCLTGVSSGGRSLPLDLGKWGRGLVLENAVIFGSVNANRRHYEAAAEALRRADRAWLESLITRRVKVSDWMSALERRADDVKPILDFTLG